MNEGGEDGKITFLNGIKVTTVGSATSPEPCFLRGHTTKSLAAASFAKLTCQLFWGVSETKDGVSPMDSFFLKFHIKFQRVVAIPQLAYHAHHAVALSILPSWKDQHP